ncbi:hypothetical protein LJC64_00615 [Ruminococcaceae bacterium OttesenSCG-928-A11]|nr:hypothetical protein [Ruminococcaceae bacterium OttesenSCG-928-A11]
MRITHNMLTRTYLKRMDTALNNLTKSNDKMTSGRAFNKSYENVSDAGRALKVRKLIADNERQLTTIRDAEGRANAAEDGLRAVNSLLIRAEDLVVEGLNGTMSETDRQKIGTELEKMRDEVFQIMNNKFSDKYLYNAAGNADGSAPFDKDAAGNLTYNGYNVAELRKNQLTGTIQHSEGGTFKDIDWNTSNYVDIGYGYTLDDGTGRINANTAFLDTFSGVDCFGVGTNADGVPINAYSLLDSMVSNLNSNNMEALGKDLDAIADSMEYLLTSITTVGARVTTLEDTGGRLEAELIGLQETQGELESVDLAHEIIYNKTFEQSWMVTLQLGSKILPTSIFDFLR